MNQIEVEKRIRDIQNDIQTVIDKHCKKSRYTITYCETNAALINILNSNNKFERRSLIEE